MEIEKKYLLLQEKEALGLRRKEQLVEFVENIGNRSCCPHSSKLNKLASHTIREPEFAVADDEEIVGGSLGDLPLSVEHDPFIHTGTDRIHLAVDVVQVVQGFNLRVETVGTCPARGADDGLQAVLVFFFRIKRCQIVEINPMLDLFRIIEIDQLHFEKSKIPLTILGRPYFSFDCIARSQPKAANLAGRYVNIVRAW